MGCNCGKNKSPQPLSARPSRKTVYQVVRNQSVLGEFASLAEARKEAIAEGGSVRVTSKMG